MRTRMAGEYLPKSTAITHHQPYLDSIEDELDDQLRAVLGIRTPSEVFSKLLAELRCCHCLAAPAGYGRGKLTSTADAAE